MELIATSGELATSYTGFNYKWELYIDSRTTATTTVHLRAYMRWVSGTGSTKRYVCSVGQRVCPVRNPNGASESCQNKKPTTWNSSKETLARMRHNWTIKYIVDGSTTYYRGMLPDDNAQYGVQWTGHLHMQKGKWYAWGPDKIFTWKNDGSKHTVQVTMSEPAFRYPAHAPASDSTAYKVVTMPTNAIVPGTVIPQIVGDWWNYKVTWSAATNAVKYIVQEYTSIDWTWRNVATTTSRTYYPSDYYRFPAGTEVYYRIISVSSTGNYRTGHYAPPKIIGGGVKIKVDNTWKQGTAFIKTNNSWHRAHEVYIKDNTTWNISKS